MKTMTIHADEVFAESMRAYAAKLGKSVNQTIKDVFAPIFKGTSCENLTRADGGQPVRHFESVPLLNWVYCE